MAVVSGTSAELDHDGMVSNNHFNVLLILILININIVGPLPPTPHYNNGILVEMGSREHHLETIYGAIKECPSLVDGLFLCKVWLRQRELDKVSI